MKIATSNHHKLKNTLVNLDTDLQCGLNASLDVHVLLLSEKASIDGAAE